MVVTILMVQWKKLLLYLVALNVSSYMLALVPRTVDNKSKSKYWNESMDELRVVDQVRSD